MSLPPVPQATAAVAPVPVARSLTTRGAPPQSGRVMRWSISAPSVTLRVELFDRATFCNPSPSVLFDLFGVELVHFRRWSPRDIFALAGNHDT